MIRYSLVCAAGHGFEGWFQSSAAFDEQSARQLISCPACASRSVSKAIMAPAVATHREPRESAPVNTPATAPASAGGILPTPVADMIRELRQEIRKHADYVGPRFAEEARRIHHREAPERGIYGEAAPSEIVELQEEGIDVIAIPRLPEDHN